MINQENLFKAIDLISSKKSKPQQNNNIIVGTIKKYDEEKQTYLVSDGIVEFFAFGEKKYKVDDTVIIAALDNSSFKQILGYYCQQSVDSDSSQLSLKDFSATEYLENITLRKNASSTILSNASKFLMSINRQVPTQLQLVADFSSNNPFTYELKIEILGKRTAAIRDNTEKDKVSIQEVLKPKPLKIQTFAEDKPAETKIVYFTFNQGVNIFNKRGFYVIKNKQGQVIEQETFFVQKDNLANFSIVLKKPSYDKEDTIEIVDMNLEGLTLQPNKFLFMTEPVLSLKVIPQSTSLLDVFYLSSSEMIGVPSNFNSYVPQGKVFSLLNSIGNHITGIKISLIGADDTTYCTNIALTFQYYPENLADNSLFLYVARTNSLSPWDNNVYFNEEIVTLTPYGGKNFDFSKCVCEQYNHTSKTWRPIPQQPPFSDHFFNETSSYKVILHSRVSQELFRVKMTIEKGFEIYSDVLVFHNIASTEPPIVEDGYLDKQNYQIVRFEPTMSGSSYITLANDPILYDKNNYLDLNESSIQHLRISWDDTNMPITLSQLLKESEIEWKIPKYQTFLTPYDVGLVDQSDEEDPFYSYVFQSVNGFNEGETFHILLSNKYNKANLLNNRIYCNILYKQEIQYNLFIDFSPISASSFANGYQALIVPKQGQYEIDSAPIKNCLSLFKEKKIDGVWKNFYNILFEVKVFSEDLKAEVPLYQIENGEKNYYFDFVWKWRTINIRNPGYKEDRINYARPMNNNLRVPNAQEKMPETFFVYQAELTGVAYGSAWAEDHTLSVEVKERNKLYSLTDSLPIAYCAKEIDNFTFPYHIAYDEFNLHPSWNLSSIKWNLNSEAAADINDIQFKLAVCKKRESFIDPVVYDTVSLGENKYGFAIAQDAEKKTPVLQPPKICPNTTENHVVCGLFKNGKIIASAPLNIERTENVDYANQESTHTKEGTIISPIFASGMSYNANSELKNGIFFGTVDDNVHPAKTGLFGFKDSQPIFELSDVKVNGLVNRITTGTNLSASDLGDGEYHIELNPSVKPGTYYDACRALVKKGVPGSTLRFSDVPEKEEMYLTSDKKAVTLKYRFGQGSAQQRETNVCTIEDNGHVHFKDISFWSINANFSVTDAGYRVTKDMFKYKKMYLTTLEGIIPDPNGTEKVIHQDMVLCKDVNIDNTALIATDSWGKISGSTALCYRDSNGNISNFQIIVVFEDKVTEPQTEQHLFELKIEVISQFGPIGKPPIQNYAQALGPNHYATLGFGQNARFLVNTLRPYC